MRMARIYDKPDGGRRILVDRLWPRGITKAAAQLDAWAKDIAPSDMLRRAFHAGMPFEAFAAAYCEELDDADLSVLAGEDVVLLTAAKHSPCHAHVLAEVAARRAGNVGGL